MGIMDFIENAVGIETLVAECYKTLAVTGEPKYAALLTKLSHDEINHRNILFMGRTFIAKAPDLFDCVIVPKEELDEGRRALGYLLEDIRAENADWWENLAKLSDLEFRLERVHLAVSVVINDPSLRALFKGLSAGDQIHAATLRGILSESPGARACPQSGGAAGAPG